MDIERKRDIARRVKRARQNKGLTQREAAERLGCSVHMVYLYERLVGGQMVPTVRLVKMTEVYEVSADELLGTLDRGQRELLRLRAVDVDRAEQLAREVE